jgi:hypothetical protein
MLARNSRPPGRPTTRPRGEAHVLVDTDKLVGGSRLLGDMHDLIRRRHYSIRTEQAYLECAKRFVLFHGKRHPKEMRQRGQGPGDPPCSCPRLSTRSVSGSGGQRPSTPRTSQPAWARSTFPTPCPGNIRMRPGNGDGSISSPRIPQW